MTGASQHNPRGYYSGDNIHGSPPRHPSNITIEESFLSNSLDLLATLGAVSLLAPPKF